MSAGVTVQSTICSEATTATKAPGVALIAARRFSARCRSGVCSRETDSVRCITTKLLQANYVADLAQGWQCDRTARRLHADDRTVSGCAGPRLDRRGENIRAHPLHSGDQQEAGHAGARVRRAGRGRKHRAASFAQGEPASKTWACPPSRAIHHFRRIQNFMRQTCATSCVPFHGNPWQFEEHHAKPCERNRCAKQSPTEEICRRFKRLQGNRAQTATRGF